MLGSCWGWEVLRVQGPFPLVQAQAGGMGQGEGSFAASYLSLIEALAFP